jgi:hypothetical protein
MNNIHRVLALGLTLAVWLPAEEVRRPEDKKRLEEQEKKRTTSVAKWRDPKGNIKTNVKVNKAFETALAGGKKEDRKTGTPPKDKSGAPPAGAKPNANGRKP